MMKKLVLFILISIIPLINSCGNKGNKPVVNTIKFWHFWSEPNQRIVIKSLIEEFEKENKCKVELTELSWNDGKTKLFAAFNAGNAPDVLELGSDWVAQFSSAGVLLELPKEFANTDKYIDFSLSPVYWNDKIYCLPWIVDTRVLFYNKKLVPEPTLKSIESGKFDYNMLNLAASQVNGNGIYGWGANGSDRHRLYKKIVSFFWSFGGEVLDSNSNPVLNSAANARALEKYAELSRAGIIETQRQLDAAFVEGRMAFWLSGGWLLEKIKNENPLLDFGVTLVPGDTGKQGISFAGGEYLAINSKTGNKELSKKFVKYMTDGKNSIKFCKVVIEAGFPADKAYFQDEFYKSQPNRLVFANQLQFARMTPVHPKWLDMEQIIEDAAVEVLYGKSSAQDALNKAQGLVRELGNK
jgi:multiple sugar transport system substrate-binding protein